MEDLGHRIRCNNCCYEIDLKEVRLDTEIKSCDTEVNGRKEHIIAVCYYFICPMCYHRYNCFYKDRMVNELFRLGRQQEAQERMEMLWELFENGS